MLWRDGTIELYPVGQTSGQKQSDDGHFLFILAMCEIMGYLPCSVLELHCDKHGANEFQIIAELPVNIFCNSMVLSFRICLLLICKFFKFSNSCFG